LVYAHRALHKKEEKKMPNLHMFHLQLHQHQVLVHMGLVLFGSWQGGSMMLGLMGLMKVKRVQWMGPIPDRGTSFKQFLMGAIGLGVMLWFVCNIR